MTEKEYFEEELSGEPLTQDSVIEGLKEFAKQYCEEKMPSDEKYLQFYEVLNEVLEEHCNLNPLPVIFDKYKTPLIITLRNWVKSWLK